ncbi:MAG TPA: hypothetical protein VG755_17050 [Nannocystaceae bacterium]|nr:hypothetical protein [Nannocystaceae bacterium]
MTKSTLLFGPALCMSFLLAGCPDDSTEPTASDTNNDTSTSNDDDPDSTASVTVSTTMTTDETMTADTTNMTTTMSTTDTTETTDNPTTETTDNPTTETTENPESSSSSNGTESSSSSSAMESSSSDTGMMGVWNCDPDYYGTDDGCDCGCGIPDPDCADGDIGTCVYCNDPGACNIWDCPGTIDPNDTANCAPVEGVPDEWTCNPQFYGDGTCDCGCGAVDSDCADASVDSCEVCAEDGSCGNGDCPGNIDPMDNSTCVPNMGDPWGDCLNDGMTDVTANCAEEESTCIIDNGMPATVGVCAELGCTTDADCYDMPGTGTAAPICTDLGFGNVCILDCSGGETCPDGMDCFADIACLWPD